MNQKLSDFYFLFLITTLSFMFCYCSHTLSGTVEAEYSGQFSCDEIPDSPYVCAQVEAVDSKTRGVVLATTFVKNGHPCDTCRFIFNDIPLGSYNFRVVKFGLDYLNSYGGEGCKETIQYFKDPSDTSKLLEIEVDWLDFNTPDVDFLVY